MRPSQRRFEGVSLLFKRVYCSSWVEKRVLPRQRSPPFGPWALGLPRARRWPALAPAWRRRRSPGPGTRTTRSWRRSARHPQWTRCGRCGRSWRAPRLEGVWPMVGVSGLGWVSYLFRMWAKSDLRNLVADDSLVLAQFQVVEDFVHPHGREFIQHGTGTAGLL